MDEKEVTVCLREWLEDIGVSVYTGTEFRVAGGRRRPDMVTINKANNRNTALELKRSRDEDIFKSYKIIDYARAYRNGVRYLIDGIPVNITNFLVATELSKDGRIFANDIQYNEKKRKKQAEFYEKVSYIEPYWEWARSGDFVRSIWRMWNLCYDDKDGMKGINIGILLSTLNDKLTTTRSIPQPKMFVMHFSKTKQRWTSWWTKL